MIDRLIRTGAVIRFQYVNWRGAGHEYEVIVESVEFGPYDAGGKSANVDKAQWVLHGWVCKRDGEPRPGRRTFLMVGMMYVDVRR